jgi:glycosyltransferase involved in cell wall biosynthesis
VYNARRYMRQSIESVLRQSYGDFELILLEDGSTDGTVELVHDVAAGDPRAVVLGGEHRGYVHWLNVGLHKARGEFIARMDADDVCHPDRFEAQVRFLDAHANCVAVGCQADRIDPDGDPIDHWEVPLDHEEIDARHLRGLGGSIIHPSVMMRRAAVMAIHGYNPLYEPAEDLDLFLRLAEIGRLANLPDALLSYRVHDRCVSFARAAEQSKWTARAVADARSRRGHAEPAPALVERSGAPSTDELMWSWVRRAFAAGNFGTARKHALRLVRRRPLEARRWMLLAGACLGPVAGMVRRLLPLRVGPYESNPAPAARAVDIA